MADDILIVDDERDIRSLLAITQKMRLFNHSGGKC